MHFPCLIFQLQKDFDLALVGSMRRMSWKHKKDTFFKKHKSEQNPGKKQILCLYILR